MCIYVNNTVNHTELKPRKTAGKVRFDDHTHALVEMWNGSDNICNLILCSLVCSTFVFYLPEDEHMVCWNM
jgi:hypothetical protein